MNVIYLLVMYNRLCRYHPSEQYSIEISDKFTEQQDFEMTRKNFVVQARLTCN